MKSTPVVLASEPFAPKVNKINNKLSTSITKQARSLTNLTYTVLSMFIRFRFLVVFEEYENDGRIHPVETDDIT